MTAARTTWSRSYVTVIAPGGEKRPWRWPDPAPQDLSDRAALGLPSAGKLDVRWRHPGAINARQRQLALTDPRALTLVRDIEAAAAAHGAGWRVSSTGEPVPAPAAPGRSAAPARPAAPSLQAPAPVAAVPTGRRATALGRPYPTGDDRPRFAAGEAARRLALFNPTLVAPTNPVLCAVADGDVALGATVSDLLDLLVAEHWDSWGPRHRSNMLSALGFVDHALRYAEPLETDTPEVAAWKRARLDLPGITVGDSLHVALILSPDLSDAIALRRFTDLRTELLNATVTARYDQAWVTYLRAVHARQAGTRHGGRLPRQPPETLLLREPQIPVKARTEQFFARHVGTVLRMADSRGLLPSGINPWLVFAPNGHPTRGYRRPPVVQVGERAVPPLGLIVRLAETIATLGPDTGAGPRGARFYALVLAAVCTAARLSELAGLRPTDYRGGPVPTLTFTHSAGPVSPTVSDDGMGWEEGTKLKARNQGHERVVGLPRPVADAIEAHLAAGYASIDHLFAGPDGGPLRWGALTERYWRPAVAAVLGGSSSAQLRDMEPRWLRKAGITWMLRSGRSLTEVADTVGNSPVVILEHYAGVVDGSPSRQVWTGWDDAWAWGITETDVP